MLSEQRLGVERNTILDVSGLQPEQTDLSIPADIIVAHLQLELQALRAKQAQLELEVLNSRDQAHGQSEAVGQLRHQSARQDALFDQRTNELAIHEANRLAHIARLEAALAAAQQERRDAKQLQHELQSLKSSVTWRLGRLALLPVRVAKRLRPRR